jgi:hypothetical protein
MRYFMFVVSMLLAFSVLGGTSAAARTPLNAMVSLGDNPDLKGAMRHPGAYQSAQGCREPCSDCKSLNELKECIENRKPLLPAFGSGGEEGLIKSEQELEASKQRAVEEFVDDERLEADRDLRNLVVP